MNRSTFKIAINNKTVAMCRLQKEVRGIQRIVPGIIHKNSCYVRIDSYTLEEYTQAQWKHWLLKGKNIENLIIEEDEKYGIWAVEKGLKIVTTPNIQVDFVYSLDLKELVTQMRDENGVGIRNRRYRLRMYPKCFVGNEAVDWMRRKLDVSLTDAIELGQRLIDEKWLHHVCDEHSFENSHFFYRFYLDE